MRARLSDLRASRDRGYTLVELLVTLTVLAVVMGVIMTVLTMTSRSKTTTSNGIESVQSARVAVDMMSRDLRSAGYGADLDWTAAPQPAIAYIDSLQVLMCADFSGGFAAPRDTVAYDPAGNPKPYPLNGTAWQPPIKYRSGAEIIRWTLDANNDGAVDAGDIASANGIDAQRTPNPSDYELLRQVYGDSLNDAAGDNGGAVERIALIKRPCTSGVPAMFQVYMKGSSTAYDWSNGPVPVNQLANIQRITITAVASSARPDWRGRFADTKIETQVNSLRNVPDWGQNTYTVDGYVFSDVNKNGSRDAGEVGLAGVTVRCGRLAASTDLSGYYVFRMGPGTYTLRSVAPPGYGVRTSPDSFVVVCPTGATRSFADTARAGGWIHITDYNDLNGNATKDAGENGLTDVRNTNTVTGDLTYSGAGGADSLFSPVGSWIVSVTPPDSFMVTTTNPLSGTMTNGGSASITFGLKKSGIGTIKGTVYKDNNKNGVMDAGEGGIQNVWVGVSNDGGTSTQGYAYTDASGNYSIDVPANPSGPAYTLYTIVSNGYFATTSTSIGGITLTTGQVLTGQNFGEVGYQIITLSAQRVLSLASGDLIENDWNGGVNSWDTKGVHDVDLILGSDAGGTDQISTWFNQYNASPLFGGSPDYTRAAPQSVLCLSADTLDSTVPTSRVDLVTGTKKAASGNIFVWITQSSSGNLGYSPTTPTSSYTTSDGGDVQALLTTDCSGGGYPDIIAGTKSPTNGKGTVEIWQNGEGASPTFTRQEIYPAAGSIPGSSLGEVTALALGDFDGDGAKDLVIGTHLSDYSGELVVMRRVGSTNGNRYLYATGTNFGGAAVTSLTCADVDNDGKLDIIVGLQDSDHSGKLRWYKNTTVGSLLSFTLMESMDAPGVPLSLVSGDFGGSNRSDIILGYRDNMSGYTGGLRVYYTDFSVLIPGGTDPSNGQITNMVPAITTANFNYGWQPSVTAGPYLLDFACAVKTGTTSGQLIVFIR